ncbi:MAG: type III pantothenate kinase, partial [Candidatus Dormibacteraceae bacterium]
MLLAIDIGNTNVVIGLYDEEDLIAHWRISTPADWTPDEVATSLGHLFALRRLDVSAVTDVVIASVVPSLNAALQETSIRH